MAVTRGTGYTFRKRVYRVSFRTMLPDRLKVGMSKSGLRAWLLSQAATALVAELLAVDGLFDIDVNYDICTLETHITHSLEVLIKEK